MCAATYFDLPVSCDPESVARAAEVVGHAADEPKTAFEFRDRIRSGGIVVGVGGFHNALVARVEPGKKVG